MSTQIYKKASKQRLRVSTEKGPLSVEQLWDLPIVSLDKLAVSLEESYKKSGKKSFLEIESKKDKELKLKFEIVLDILQTKVENADKASKANQTRSENNKLNEIIQRKKDVALESLTIEELEKRIK
jgi:hypothetical protein